MLETPGIMTILAVFTTIFGLILGSFFNVLIYRLPLEVSIAWPGSYCPQCKRPIRPIENIPVLSYLFLRGRCAGCKTHISLLYPIIEAVTGILALMLFSFLIEPALRSSPVWYSYVTLGLQIVSLLILVPITIIDIEHYIIPDSITIPGVILGCLVVWIPGGITPIDAGLGILAGGGTLFAIGFIGELIFKKEAMGLGDVKLMAFLGSLWGWKIALMAIIFGSLLGSIIGLGLIACKVLKREHHIPFGPFLAAGMLVAVLCGSRIVTWYFGFIEQLVHF